MPSEGVKNLPIKGHSRFSYSLEMILTVGILKDPALTFLSRDKRTPKLLVINLSSEFIFIVILQYNKNEPGL